MYAFERQALAEPNRLAVVAGDERLTYQELHHRASHLARHLSRVCPLQPDDRVGLLLDRGAGLPLGILAALQAGGCYVPLEPTLPPERLRYILANAGCRVVLASASTVDRARACAAVPVVDLDDLPEREMA